MSKVLIMVAEGSDDVEFSHSYSFFQKEGYAVDVVATEADKTYRGNHGLPMRSNVSPGKVNIEEYDALIIPGGGGPAKICGNAEMVEVVKKAYDRDKVIAAICGGPKMLVAAGILDGKRATCFRTLASDIEKAGAKYVDAEVVVDGNIVTSRFPPDLPYFCKETLALLRRKK
jgi:protease I